MKKNKSEEKGGSSPSSLPFAPVILSTGIPLSGRFEQMCKVEAGSSQSPVALEDYEMERVDRRVDWMEGEEGPGRCGRSPHGSLLDERRLRFRRPPRTWATRVRPFRPLGRGFHFQFQGRQQNMIPVHYRLSIPRDRYDWNGKTPFHSHFHQDSGYSRRPYGPRRRPFGTLYRRAPIRSEIGRGSGYSGYHSRGKHPVFRGRGRTTRKQWISREKLDLELDQYMSLSRSYLDRQLDQYVEEVKAAATANFAVGNGACSEEAGDGETLLLDAEEALDFL